MQYLWEFEIYESGKFFVAEPVNDLGEGTFGEDFKDAVESAADWFTMVVDDHLMKGESLPEPVFGGDPSHGGKMVVIVVSRELGDIPAMTTAEAAEVLGIDDDAVGRLIEANLLESWMCGSARMVSKASVEARKEAVGL